MNFAIIAAGEGSRLAAGGIETPKPLIAIGGTTLIDRLIAIFMRHKASSISIIVNEEASLVIEHLQKLSLPIPLNLIIKSTAGSMHSLYELKPFLQNNDFCLTTVDTVFLENEFTDYLNAFHTNRSIDGLMAATNFIDDEKPLYIATNDKKQITDFCDQRPTNCNYISGGIYCLRPKALDVLEKTIASGMTRMRDFQRQLIRQGLTLNAFPFSKIVDIDHPCDIATAENFIGNSETLKS